MGADLVHKDLSYQIVGLAMNVYNVLGSGFLEKVYENAMMVAFRKAGIEAEQQASVKVHFDGEVVGEYYADILVENQIILELKVVSEISNIHRAQLLNYLKATKLRLGMILNFGKQKLEYLRFVN